MPVPAIPDSANAHASNAVLELDGCLVSASAADLRPHELGSDAVRRFAVCHVFENAVECLKVLFLDGQAAILSQDSELKHLEDCGIRSEEVRLRGRRGQLLHVQRYDDVHTTDCVFGWMKS